MPQIFGQKRAPQCYGAGSLRPPARTESQCSAEAASGLLAGWATALLSSPERPHAHHTLSAVTSKSPDMAVQRGPNPSLVEKPLSYSDRRTKSKAKDSLQISSTLQFPRSVDLAFLHYFNVSPKFHIFPME